MSIHEATIRLLKRDIPGLQTRHFRRSVCALEILEGRRQSESYPDLITYAPTSFDDENCFPIDWEGYRRWGEPPEFRRIPDGFLLDFKCQMAVVFEVEDTSRLDIKKLGDYYELYLEHLDPLGWGLSLIGVDRWGRRFPIPFFDYVFSEMIDDIPDRTLLKAMQCATEVEHRYSVALCDQHKLLETNQMFQMIADARLRTSYKFWQSSKAREAFDCIMKEGK